MFLRLLAVLCVLSFVAHPGPCSVKVLEGVAPNAAADSGCSGDCSPSCPQEETGQCPPDCQLCVCCSAARFVIPTVEFVLQSPRAESMPDVETVLALRSADIHEVFHVPKTFLA